MSEKSDMARRTVVKALSASAGLTAGLAAMDTPAGVATASHGGSCSCFFETNCDTTRFCEENPDPNNPYQQQHRECCECDGSKVCEDQWHDVTGGCCSG